MRETKDCQENGISLGERGKKMGKEAREEVREEMGEEVREKVGEEVEEDVREEVGKEVREEGPSRSLPTNPLNIILAIIIVMFQILVQSADVTIMRLATVSRKFSELILFSLILKCVARGGQLNKRYIDSSSLIGSSNTEVCKIDSAYWAMVISVKMPDMFEYTM
uniref:Uncharacterized protein n=1 Tax=Glossina brevipalpis TaxID=37001 RepID=A0A1A9WPF7_9MUSC